MSPQPIAAYLTDFDAPPVRAPAAPPPGHAVQGQAAHHEANHAANPGASRAGSHPADRLAPHAPAHAAAHPEAANDDGTERAFAAGKEEGVKLAEARHALERRKREAEEGRRAAERVAEAEARIGALFAERLAEEVAALEDRLSREASACLAPFVIDAAERVAAEAMAREAARLVDAARWRVCGPRRLIDAFTRALDPSLRERVAVEGGEGIELTVTADATRLSTRVGALRGTLAAA